MSLTLAATTLALVIPAELPDKTFISCVILAARYKGLAVWLGGALALTVQALLAVVAGGLLTLLPHTAVRIVVAVLFLGGAAYLIFVPEEAAEAKGERLGAQAASAASFWRVLATTFAIVALAEFGDITQVLIANLEARYREPVSVFAGAAAGFWLVSGLGVLAGRWVVRVVPLSLVRRISGAALLGLGAFTIATLVR